MQKSARNPAANSVSRKPTNRRAFIAWLTHQVQQQHGITLEMPVRYESLRRAIELCGIRPGDER